MLTFVKVTRPSHRDREEFVISRVNLCTKGTKGMSLNVKTGSPKVDVLKFESREFAPFVLHYNPLYKNMGLSGGGGGEGGGGQGV